MLGQRWAEGLDAFQADAGLERPELLRRLRRLAAAEATGQRGLAARLGVSASYLNDVIRGRKCPGDKLLRGLGLRRVALYVRRARRRRG